MSWLDRDSTMRAAAFSRFQHLQRVHQDAIPWSAIDEGFQFEGQRLPLSSKAEGIYKPAGHPAALSIKTTLPRKGRDSNPYVDELNSEDGQMMYAYRERGGADNAANQSLRVAQLHQLPLCYLWAVSEARYAAILPVFVVQDHRDQGLFGVAPGEVMATIDTGTYVHSLLHTAPERRYAARLVRQRLHQRAFREQVLDAYGHHCAMCSIKFDELLEAAHILPDSSPRGLPEVQNGLALCTLHHQAYDRYLVSVTEDYRVRLSPDFLRRTNGDIFRAAFLEREGKPIHLPRNPVLRPHRGYLAERLRLAG